MKQPNFPLLPIGAMLLGFSLPNTTVAQSNEVAPTLPTVEVKAAAEKEPGGGYQAATTTIGKLKQLPKDVPQALTIITGGLMRDAGSDTLKDALRNVAGLTFNSAEGGRIGDNINLRGFYSFGDLYLDGIRDVAQYNRETFNLEQIDVLRGSAAMLFGRGQAGGVVNQVSKEPELINKTTFSGTIGTNDYKRITADTNQKMGENTAIRVTAMKTDAGSTRDNVKTEREGIAPTLRWGIGTKNEFSIGHYYLKTHNTPDYGVPFFQTRPLDVAANRWYGTNADYEDNTTNISTATYKHRFSADTEIRTVLRAANYTRDLWAVAPRVAAGVTSISDSTAITRGRQARGAEEHTITSQTDLTTRFNALGVKHEVLAGVELLDEQASRWSYLGSGTGVTAPNTTVGNPNPNPVLPLGYGSKVKSSINHYDGFSKAIYGQDSVEFLPGWKALLGLRYDTMKATYQAPTTTTNVKYGQWSYRTGLSWQPRDEEHYYLAYNDSFSPTADLYQFSSGPKLDPERSQTIEVGAKWELFDGNLSLRTSLYRSIKEWERNTDTESASAPTAPSVAPNSILSKKRHTDGFEIEAAGRITQRWEVFSGISLMHSVIDEMPVGRTPSYNGMLARNTPKAAANLWSTYRFDGGWRAGIGMEAKSSRLAYGMTTTGTASITPNVAPGYARWDAMVAYEKQNYAFKLNVLNLFDKRYYAGVYENGGFTVPGTRRAAQLTAEFKF